MRQEDLDALVEKNKLTLKAMKKQTAVEWLFAHLLPFLPFSDAKEREHFRKCLEQAKAMEKEQMFDYIKKNYVNGEHSLKFHKEEFEQYYNETYGQ